MQITLATVFTFLVTVCCVKSVHSYALSRRNKNYFANIDENNSQEIDSNMIVLREVNNEASNTADDPSFCNSHEPCLFVMSKRNPKDNSVHEKRIPSWCHCRENDECKFSFYDRKKKAKTYKCTAKVDENMQQDQDEQMSDVLLDETSKRRHYRRF